ncbi:Reticulocyte-binding protein 2-like protein a [Colletotrichum sp. SAR 10_99]|nr:Reticulocyte-binding protein 2-like protein a [Colletotrichum sp. SAR 10_96]KAJ5014478.1 Reticulocyte-binding protein 2-like protein a [Colletotrichum sp. SAR 10_99]
MASASVDAAAGATAANDAPAPRKYKASDLPLPSATRAAIDSLAHSFKKKGGYDAIRKEVWDKFAASDYEEQVTKAILEVAEHEVQRNPHQLLTLDRGKAAALIDGALERSGVYQKAEQVITQLIDKKAIEERMRQLRRADIGEEEATAEQQRGAKTDEEYHADTMGRRAERERREEETEKAKKNLTQEDLKRLEEEALLDLLRESTHGAAKQPEMEIDEALAPPPRKLAPASAIMPIKKVSSRDSPKVSESKKPSDPVVKKEARDASVAAAPKVETTETRTRSRSRSRDGGKDRERDRDDERRRTRDDNDRRRRDRRSRSASKLDKEQEVRETTKMDEVRKREKEAKAYLAAQREAREKGMPVPGIDDKRSTGERSPEAKRKRDLDEIDRYGKVVTVQV